MLLVVAMKDSTILLDLTYQLEMFVDQYMENINSTTSLDTKEFMNISMIEKSINDLEKILKLHDNFLPLKRSMPYGELTAI